jgi:predicted dehydrogenase
MSDRLNRRTFLMGTAGTIAGVSLARSASHAAPGDKLKLGIIGCGGRGAGNWGALTGEEVVMLCDVDLNQVTAAKKTFPDAEVVQDFRRVLDRKDIDAVVVSTPDHWHAIPSIWAMETGKHVYCEKPLARTVYEIRAMREAAKKYRRVTQMGTQIHAGANYRRVVELVKAGAIGPIRKVDVWCEKRPSPGKRVVQGTPPPTLDYDLWVGPAEWRPYDPGVVPFNWRWWWEFGGGVLADMACHFMDLPHWALDLTTPERVKASGTQMPDAENTVPLTMRVDFSYPARGSQPPVQLTWWHGNRGPQDEAGNVQSYGYGSGVLFHGEQGQLIADYGSHKLLPEDRFSGYQRPPQTVPDSVGHHQEWVNGIKNGTPTTCNWEYSGALAETVLLGNVAYRLGKEIEWDAKKLRIKNAKEKEYEALLKPNYRGDWKLKRG